MKNSPFTQRRTQILIVAGAFFLEVLDATIITPALVSMSLELNSTVSAVTISTTSYMFSLTLFTPISGRFFRNINFRTKFLGGIVIFWIGSLVCSISQDIYQLGFARMLQGVGSSILIPSGRSMILENTPQERIPTTMALLVWPALIGPIFAPVLGGYIVELYNWRYIFFLMLLLSGALFLVSKSFLLDYRFSNNEENIEWQSYVLWVSFVTSIFLFFVLTVNHHLIASFFLLVSTIFSLLMLSHRLLKQCPGSVFDVSLLNNDFFKLNIFSGSLFRVSIYAFPVVFTIYMIKVGGYSAVYTGNCLAFIFLGNLIAKPVAVHALKQFDNLRHYFVTSSFLNFMSLSFFLFEGVYDRFSTIAALCFFHGIARSFQFLGYSSTAVYQVRKENMYMANIFSSSIMQINSMLGQALPALLALSLNSATPVSQHGRLYLFVGMGAVLSLSFFTIFTSISISNVNNKADGNRNTRAI